ncbi:MAG TPA: ABC transporter ATP-binding protein [Phycisphaerae bacterium]|nr:ABC transporter ATP-binding protein [Phycisphaerae bacterium]
MAVIELDRLSKWYGEVIGLNKITAVVESGITGLIGPNGAGKSTLMGLAMGLLRPSTGSIRLFGQPVWNNPAALSKVGYCPEGDVFWPEMTGWQFVLFLARASGLRGAAARKAASEAIELTGMKEDMHRAIRGYSKGMRQRIKIAQALTHDPRLLILDEPFTGADPVARHDLTALFRDLAEAGIDILISSHVLHEVEAMTRQILMIHHGRIVAEGDLLDVRRQMRDRPYAIRVRVNDPRRLAAALIDWEIVAGIQVVSADTMIVETQSPDRVYDHLPEMILSQGLTVKEIAAADASLEAVFGYLTASGM